MGNIRFHADLMSFIRQNTKYHWQIQESTYVMSNSCFIYDLMFVLAMDTAFSFNGSRISEIRSLR